MSPIAIAVVALLVFLIMRMPAFAKFRPKLLMFAGGGLVLWLVVTGKLHALFAVFAAALPMLQRLMQVARFWPFINKLLGKGSAGTGHTSSVSTQSLQMVLDLNSGKISGQCSDGPCAGAELDQLDADQLDQQLQWCQQHDPDAVGLLQRYARQRFGAGTSQQQEEQVSAPNPSSLTRKQAAEILGVDENADAKTVKEAHRRLIAKLHPDKGGNDYLASLLNQAKDRLG